MKLTREEVLELALKLEAKPILYTDVINDVQMCRDDLWLLTTEQLINLCSAHLAKQLAESAVAPGECVSVPDAAVWISESLIRDEWVNHVNTDPGIHHWPEVLAFAKRIAAISANKGYRTGLEARVPDADEITADQCIELEGELQKEWARKAIAETRAAASLLEHVEFRGGMETACDEIEARIGSGYDIQSGISSLDRRPNEKDVVGEEKQ